MTTQQEMRQNHISEACSKFNCDIDTVRKLLGTCCFDRLNISERQYSNWSRALDVIPSHALKLEDRKNYRNEVFIKAICKKLKISQESLCNKVKNYMFVPVSSNEIYKIREIFGLKVNKSEMLLKNRPQAFKNREQKIIKLFSEGKTYREVAKEVGLTMNNVITRVNRLRRRFEDSKFLPLRPPGRFNRPEGYTPENIGKLLRDGKSVSDIAKQFGKKHHSMISLINRWRDAYPHANIPYIRVTK